MKEFAYKTSETGIAFEMEGYYVWDSSVIKVGKQYHLFCSRWKEEYGFGEPTHIFCASGNGAPYAFEGRTFVVCTKLEKK